MSERKVVRRSVAVALGITCIFLVVGVVGAVAVYNSMLNDRNDTIASKDSQLTSLNSQLSSLEFRISSLNTQVADLQDRVSNLTIRLKVTVTPLDTASLNLSALVYETIVVEGKLTGPLVFIPEGMPPWGYELDSNGTVIGISWNGGDFFNWTSVRVYGVVTQGTLSGGLTEPPGTVYYVRAERIDLL